MSVAEQRAPRGSRTQTYNGVGKSLMFALLHFRLGSNANKAFQQHLKGWAFYLDVELDGARHAIGRSADEKGGIWFDGQKIKLSELRANLQQACFDLEAEAKFLAFRNLITRFIRSGRGAYLEYRFGDADEVKDQFGAMLRNAFLLGLDLDLARRKRELRRREVELREAIRQLERDPLLAELLAGDKVHIELTALREQIERLRRDLERFEVAETTARSRRRRLGSRGSWTSCAART